MSGKPQNVGIVIWYNCLNGDMEMWYNCLNGDMEMLYNYFNVYVGMKYSCIDIGLGTYSVFTCVLVCMTVSNNNVVHTSRL